MPRTARYLVAALLVAAALWMIAHPLEIARLLSRPQETVSQRINLRATFGGTVLGIALFSAWFPGFAAGGRVLGAGLLGALMAGIAGARRVGFVFDGRPDTLQWVWLVAEILRAIAAAFAVHKLSAPSSSTAT